MGHILHKWTIFLMDLFFFEADANIYLLVPKYSKEICFFPYNILHYIYKVSE
jgi:hypothetical protein